MSKSIWKIEPLKKPSPSHAADAVEIVDGETVRRVVLPQLDYDVYIAWQGHPEQRSAHELGPILAIATDDVAAALTRLALAGLISGNPNSSLQ